MSSISFHRIALGPVIFGLKNCQAFMNKAIAHAEANNVDLNEYATARLYPDMYDLIGQIQRFTDTAKFIATRTNPDAPAFTNPDTEKTIPEAMARIARTIEYLEGLDPKLFEGREDIDITMQFGPVEVTYPIGEYITQFAHPNFWFHVTTTYDILRHKGVPVGKFDFMNGAGLKEFKRVEAK